MKLLKLFGATMIISTIASLAIAGTKYDGTWKFKVQTTRGNCSALPSSVEIVNGKIKGTLKSDGESFKISGKVKDDGSVKGKIGVGVASFNGQFNSNSGVGEWRGRFGCGGKVIIN